MPLSCDSCGLRLTLVIARQRRGNLQRVVLCQFGRVRDGEVGFGTGHSLIAIAVSGKMLARSRMLDGNMRYLACGDLVGLALVRHQPPAHGSIAPWR